MASTTPTAYFFVEWAPVASVFASFCAIVHFVKTTVVIKKTLRRVVRYGRSTETKRSNYKNKIVARAYHVCRCTCVSRERRNERERTTTKRSTDPAAFQRTNVETSVQ